MSKAALLLFLIASSLPAAAQPVGAAVQPARLPPAPAWPNDEPREIKARSDALDFLYSWPLEAFSIPKLNAHFESEAAKARAQALATAREDKAERGKGSPFTRHVSKAMWRVVGDNPRLLSLAAEIDIFAGGAERNSLFDALLWDKQLDRAIEVDDLFDDPDIAFTAMSHAYCRELDRLRAARGAEASGECRPLDEQIIAPVEPGGSGNGRFDRFRVLLDPYTAGSRIGGSYEVEIAVTDQVLRLVKPEYATFFAKP